MIYHYTDEDSIMNLISATTVYTDFAWTTQNRVEIIPPCNVLYTVNSLWDVVGFFLMSS